MQYNGTKVLNILDYERESRDIKFKQPLLKDALNDFLKFGIGINSVGLPLYEKSSKKQLINYIKHIEISLGSYKKILNELEKDHKQLN